MKILFSFLLGWFAISVQQDSWRLCLDKNQLFKTSMEDEQTNMITLFSAQLKKSKQLQLVYSQAATDKAWERTISLYDTNDQELTTQKGNKFTIKTSALATLLQQHKRIKFYTLYSPTDPKMKALVRLRRLHLCTLLLQ